MTVQEHEELLDRVKRMMLIDPNDLLDRHKYLLQVDFQDLGEGSSATRKNWANSVDSAVKAAQLVRSGRKYYGNPGGFTPATSTPASPVRRRDQSGSFVYRRGRRAAV